jgi:hypothetical protein
MGAKYVTARYSRTAAVTRTATLWSAPAARMPTRPSSVMPAPPGVTGKTVSRRTNANAARHACQLTWDWDRPRPRTLASRTSHSVRLLAAVVTVISQPRAASSPLARSRKPSSDPAAEDGAGLRASRQAVVSARWRAASARSANDSLRSRRPKPAATRTSSTRPATAPASRPASGLLAVTMISRAMTGRPRRAKTFQIPDTKV